MSESVSTQTDNTGTPWVRRSDLWRVYLRSFLIQGSWNFERMLALGFCFAIIPVARRLCHTREERGQFLRRHLKFFNAHPFTSSWLLGAVAKLEQQYVHKEWEDDTPILNFKERLCGPLGAIGDTLFWRRAKPIAAMCGVILAMTLGVVGVVVFLVVYNIPHLWFRLAALFQGFREGFDLVRRISVRRFQNLFDRLGLVGAGAVGILLVSSTKWILPKGSVAVAAFVGSFLISFIWLDRSRIAIPLLMVVLLLVSAVVGIVAI